MTQRVKIITLIFTVLTLFLIGAERLRQVMAIPPFEVFFEEFKQHCADGTNVRTLPIEDRAKVCGCLIKALKAQPNDIYKLGDWIGRHDRVPRGYTDFFPSVERILFVQCRS